MITNEQVKEFANIFFPHLIEPYRTLAIIAILEANGFIEVYE